MCLEALALHAPPLLASLLTRLEINACLVLTTVLNALIPVPAPYVMLLITTTWILALVLSAS